MPRTHLCLAAAIVASAPVAGQDCSWQLLRPAHNPGPSMGQSMVYDATSNRCVLFNAKFWFEDPETWAWDGSDWSFLAFGGPDSFYDHGAVLDSARDVMVVFGGDGPHDPADLRETWEFDGQTWTLRATDGPSHRSDHSMAYDAARGVTVLFGGHDDTEIFGDTWEWDGASWTERPAAGPSPRAAAVMTYDSQRGVTVLFGGWSVEESFLGDTWEWDGQAWTRRDVPGPGPRSSPAMIFDGRRCVLFGGRHYNPNLMATEVLADTWAWDGKSWMLVASPDPAMARADHTMVYDGARQDVILFGGLDQENAVLDDTWVLHCDPQCPADFDGNGVLDFFDYLAYFNAFNASDPAADCDGDGHLDLFDFLCFVNAFNQGC